MEPETMRQTKELIFSGEHPRLITGASYSIYAVSLITNISNATLYRRLKGKNEITDWDITPAHERNPERYGKKARERSQFNKLESEADRLSSAWLRVALC
jgi:hypothetical protein